MGEGGGVGGDDDGGDGGGGDGGGGGCGGNNWKHLQINPWTHVSLTLGVKQLKNQKDRMDRAVK